jgi:hypothetical protein
VRESEREREPVLHGERGERERENENEKERKRKRERERESTISKPF